MPDATIVLVHGAWHGPWCWQRVTPLLDDAGIVWTAVDLPTCNPQPNEPATLADDAAVVRGALDMLDGPTIVLGHSYGGAVVTQACDHPAVRRIVYLAAFLPDVGESVLSLATSGEPNPALFRGMQTDADGWSTLTDDCADNVFYNDADSATRAWARARLRSMRGGSADPVTTAAWSSVPTMYLLTTADRAVLPSWQRTMSRRCTEVIELPTGHSTFAVRPDLLCQHLIETARRTS